MEVNRIEEREYKAVKLTSFADSLAEQIEIWESLGLNKSQITRYVTDIQTAVDSLSYWPGRFQDVTDQYGFVEPTHRIPIGNVYAVFYRIKPDINSVIVGALFDRRRFKVKF